LLAGRFKILDSVFIENSLGLIVICFNVFNDAFSICHCLAQISEHFHTRTLEGIFMAQSLYTPLCGSVIWQGVIVCPQSAYFQSQTDGLDFIPYVMVVVKVKVIL